MPLLFPWGKSSHRFETEGFSEWLQRETVTACRMRDERGSYLQDEGALFLEGANQVREDTLLSK